jgi:hypothetical protein
MELFEAASSICDGLSVAFREKKGFLVGRNGTIEMETLLTKKYQNTFYLQQLNILQRNAGVFPSSIGSVNQWVTDTQEAIQNTDLLVAGWYEPIYETELAYLKGLGRKSHFLPLRALEPYYVPQLIQWTRYLLWKKVAVVTSFADTAKSQLAKRSAIWGDRAENLLPDAEYSFIKTGYSPTLASGRAGWPDGVESWQDAVNYVVNEVVKSEAEVVLIGCGGLSMIIGSRLKALGKICIVMGGAIQVLFGIKGNRWQTHAVISRFWNDAWVYPSLEETPGSAEAVERSCYWS